MTCEDEITPEDIECDIEEEVAVMGVKRKSYRRRKSNSRDDSKPGSNSFLSHDSKPSVYHAVVVIFLEFFAWGLLTTPMLAVLRYLFFIIISYFIIYFNLVKHLDLIRFL